MIYILGIALIFIIIVILKHRTKKYLKQGSLAVLVLAILNCILILAPSASDTNGNFMYLSVF